VWRPSTVAEHRELAVRDEETANAPAGPRGGASPTSRSERSRVASRRPGGVSGRTCVPCGARAPSPSTASLLFVMRRPRMPPAGPRGGASPTSRGERSRVASRRPGGVSGRTCVRLARASRETRYADVEDHLARRALACRASNRRRLRSHLRPSLARFARDEGCVSGARARPLGSTSPFCRRGVSWAPCRQRGATGVRRVM
jgi:hypothetical protein